MKILYITNGISGAGGLERVLSVKASMLAEEFGCEVHIISLNEEGKEAFFEFSPRITRHSVPVAGNPFSYLRSYVAGIRKKIAAIEPDIISVCDDGLKGFFIPSILRTDVPIIYERHVSKVIMMKASHGFGKFLFQCQSRLMDTLSKDFSAFVVLTQGNTAEWPSTRNIKVIPNPLSFYTPITSSLESQKVIAVGKQSFQKSYDRLLQSWQIATKTLPDWQLHIYGTKSESENLPELAKKLGVADTVFFHDPEPKIERRYIDSSIFVLSSRYEGFGMVLIEAMSCGLPVVSFDCPHGPGDIITDGHDGFLIENGNIELFAERLSELMQDRDLRIKMGAAAKETSTQYETRAIVSRWNDLFIRLMTPAE